MPRRSIKSDIETLEHKLALMKRGAPNNKSLLMVQHYNRTIREYEKRIRELKRDLLHLQKVASKGGKKNRKFTRPTDILFIRESIALGISDAAIGRMMKCSAETIRGIRLGHTYGDIK